MGVKALGILCETFLGPSEADSPSFCLLCVALGSLLSFQEDKPGA